MGAGRRFHVEFTAEAQSDLIALCGDRDWLQRGEAAAAAHRLDQLLATAPDSGTLLSEGLWMLEIRPLRYYYQLDHEQGQEHAQAAGDPDGTVSVLAVKKAPPPVTLSPPGEEEA